MQVKKKEKINISDIKKYLKTNLGLKEIRRCKDDTDLFLSDQNAFDENEEKEFNQINIISEMIKGRDVLAMMPTGTGKSLCFEVPALCADGITIIVSPITALIDSQASDFNKRYTKMPTKSGIDEKRGNQTGEVIPRAAYSGMYDLHGTAIIEEIITGKKAGQELDKIVSYKVLYVSPERLMNSKFRSRFMEAVRNKDIKVSRIVYDEVHCFSQWGWSFRPSYLRTVGWIKEYETLTGERLPRAGFTATATKADIQRVSEILELKKPKMFLSIELNSKIDIQLKGLLIPTKEEKATEEFEKDVIGPEVSLNKALNECLAANAGFDKCIIFCNQKRTVDALEKRIKGWTKLQSEYVDSIGKHTVIKYHAGMDQNERTEADGRFRLQNSNKKSADILTASIAYGLGINNKDVDLVINYGLAKSFEEYIQMLGRAGRGDKNGKAVLLYKRYSPSDSSSTISSAAKVLRWEISWNDNSPINELADRYKDLLIMLQIYRFARYKEIVEECLEKKDGKERRKCLEKLTREYFSFDVSDPNNVSKIEGCITDFANEIKACYENYIYELDEKSKSVTEQEKRDSIKRKRGKYAAIINDADEVIVKTERVIKDFYDKSIDKKDIIDDMYSELGTIISTPQMLKINNTQIANIIRKNRLDSKHKDKLSFDTRYEISQKERFIRGVKKWNGDEWNHGKLVNANIMELTGLLYIPPAKLNNSYDDLLKFVNEQYEQWKNNNPDLELKFIYGIEYVDKAVLSTSKNTNKQYKAYVVRLIWVLVDGKLKLLRFQELCERDGFNLYKKLFESGSVPEEGMVDNTQYGQKGLEEHIGSDANELHICGTNQKFGKYTLDRQMNNKDPKLVVTKELRERKISFTIIHINDVKHDKSDCTISYWDMCVFDAVYSLIFEGKNRIYLQNIWRVLSGNSKYVLSGGYKSESGYHGIKTKLAESIDKLSKLYIVIEDSQIEGGSIEGIFLPLTPNITKSKMTTGKAYGYILDEMPVLSRYADQLNGEYISIPAQKMNVKEYMPMRIEARNKTGDDFDGIRIKWDTGQYPDEPKVYIGKSRTVKENVHKNEKLNQFDSVERICLSHYILHRSAISKKNKSKFMSLINIDAIIDVLGDNLCASNRNKEYIYAFSEMVLQHDLAGYIQKNSVDVVKY